jgi:hypothetical protein
MVKPKASVSKIFEAVTEYQAPVLYYFLMLLACHPGLFETDNANLD